MYHKPRQEQTTKQQQKISAEGHQEFSASPTREGKRQARRRGRPELLFWALLCPCMYPAVRPVRRGHSRTPLALYAHLFGHITWS